MSLALIPLLLLAGAVLFLVGSAVIKYFVRVNDMLDDYYGCTWYIYRDLGTKAKVEKLEGQVKALMNHIDVTGGNVKG